MFCTDGSDEFNCNCYDDEFTCQCIHNDTHPCSTFEGCIPIQSYQDGRIDCPDGSDETKSYKKISCGRCNVEVHRLFNQTYCSKSSFDWCSRSVCYQTISLNCSSNHCNATDLACISKCATSNIENCNLVLQCSDGELILDSQFCNGVVDCADGSDEIRNQPGFKCVQSVEACSLPQRNLYDNVAHCTDRSDLCHAPNGFCFECLDKRLLVSSKQVCNGVIDCYDLSDECLCEINLNSPICNALFTKYSDSSMTVCAHYGKLKLIDPNLFDKNPNLVYALDSGNTIRSAAYFSTTNGNDNDTEIVTCGTKYSTYARPVLCDGRPTCRDFSDECKCTNPPTFCNDTCRLFYDDFYPFGDHYCDGIEDEFAWEYLNQSACPRGFDEKLCPKRFNCKSSNKISIDVSQVCNGVVDCDEGEDEQNCSISITKTKLFSSDTEMIDNVVFRIAFWVNGLVVIFATTTVIVRKIKLLHTANLTDSLRCQHTIILHVTVADFIMGVYLITIAVHNSVYSGYYGQVDLEWRSSLTCSIIGSIAVISSEASCLLMVILTGFRLHTVCNPFATLLSRMWPWKVGISAAWIMAVLVEVLPILHYHIPYFLHSIHFLVEFNEQGLWDVSNLTKFACRFAAMTNKTINMLGTEWKTTKPFLEESFPLATIHEFGYYSDTSVCMPRFYVRRGETAWEYTLAVVTLNFLAFIFIAVSYAFIFIQVRCRTKFWGERTNQTPRGKGSKMGKRIAILIATDFLCWFPICVMCYVRMNGGELPNIVYQVTAVFLLPINSVLNPFIYCLLPDSNIAKRLFCS